MDLRFWKKKENVEQRGCVHVSLNYNGKRDVSDAMSLSSVYRCVEVISNSVAQLPLEPFKIDRNGYKKKYVQSPTYYLLNKEPNRRMTRFTYIKMMVSSMLLRGNAYSYIARDEKGNAQELVYLDSDKVTPKAHDDGSVTYSVKGCAFEIPSTDMIHILNVTYDGVKGVSVIKHATNSIHLSNASESHANGFFTGGANVAGILKVQGSVTKEQSKQIKSSWEQAFTPGVGRPNGVAVLQGNMDFTPVTISPAEAQLLETRRYNLEDICRFFGVAPTKCGDLTKASYSTVEATQLAFLTDTIAPILEKFEQEFERKLYSKRERANVDVRFDTSVLLRADKSSEADYFTKLFYLGALSPNEIRQRLDLDSIEGGDTHYMQVNLQSIGSVYDNTINTNKKENDEGNSQL